MGDLKDILERLGLGDYVDSFISEGFDTWETLQDITESDLTDLNVKLGHRRKLQRAIADARGQSAEPSPHPLDKSPGDTRAANGDAANPGNGAPTAPVRTKRKYKRHPKPDLNAPERPASAYVLFSNHMRDVLRDRELSFTEMAKIVGEKWQILRAEERDKYESRASAAKERYAAEMSEYKKTDRYQQYQVYLAEFKATHNVSDKRTRLETESSTESTGKNELRSYSPGGLRRPESHGSSSLSQHHDAYHSKSSSPTGSQVSMHHSPGGVSPATAGPLRHSPYEYATYAPHNANSITPHSRRYSRSGPPTYGSASLASYGPVSETERPPGQPFLKQSSSSISSSVPSLSKDSSVQSVDSNSSGTPSTPFSVMMQDGAPISARTLPAPSPATLSQPPGSYILDHRPLPPKSVGQYGQDDPRNSASLAALLRAGELAREADKTD